jgi:hypothetical protein
MEPVVIIKTEENEMNSVLKITQESMLAQLDHEIKSQVKQHSKLSYTTINNTKTMIKFIANHHSFNRDCNVICSNIGFNTFGGISIFLENKRNHRLTIAIHEASTVVTLNSFTLTEADTIPTQICAADSLGDLAQLLARFEKGEGYVEEYKKHFDVHALLPITNSIPGRISSIDMAERTGRLYNQGAINLMSKIYLEILDKGTQGYLAYEFKKQDRRARLPFIIRTLEQDGYAVAVDFVKEELIINWYIPVVSEEEK